MKKIFLISLIVISMMLVSLGVVAATPNWDITGTWTWNYHLGAGTYTHTMIVDSMDLITGIFQGHGYYNVNGAYTWVIVNGLVNGNNIVYTIDYTGLNPTYYVNADGTISSATFMSGNANAPGQTGTWDATGTATEIDPDNDGVPYTEDNCLEVYNPGQEDLDNDGSGDACDLDDDNDGVLDAEDKCSGTVADNPTEGLGVNRHIWNGEYEKYFTTLVPAKKGAKNEAQSAFSLTDTYGCNCEQILDSMSLTTGFDFGGHYKYGCSKSILEDWNRGTYYIGPAYLETVEVPANSATPVESVSTLESGKDYFLKAYGTGTACNQPGCHITFDAEYSTSDGGLNWVDGVAAPYTSYGPDLLDLKVDGAFVDWGAYNAEHIYQIPYAGTGNLLFVVYDLAGSYSNDAGTLYVDIIEDKWVSLW